MDSSMISEDTPVKNLPAYQYNWDYAHKEKGKNIHDTAEYQQDPRQAIKEYVKDFIRHIEISPVFVLVATFKRLKKVGGVWLPDSNLKEDEFQGSAGLILKMGELAFTSDAAKNWGEYKPKTYDWVTYRPLNGEAVELKGLHCRFLKDEFIRAIVPNPTIVW